MSGFVGKTFVVTGAASGIGAALSQLLSDAGAEVIGLDVQQAQGVTHHLDLTQEVSIDQVAQALPDGIDGLANVAGVAGTAPIPVVAGVNLFGTRRLTERLVAKMQPGGAIVTIGSISSDRCTWSEPDLLRLATQSWQTGTAQIAARAVDGTDAYQISKAAIRLLVPLWSDQLLAKGIRSNGVSPGTVSTPILKEFEKSMGKDRIDAAAKAIGRHGDPIDIARACAFFLSDQAGWVNGQVLKVDGGYHAHKTTAALAGAA